MSTNTEFIRSPTRSPWCRVGVACAFIASCTGASSGAAGSDADAHVLVLPRGSADAGPEPPSPAPPPTPPPASAGAGDVVPLEPWFRALAAVDRGDDHAVASMVIVGDSHTASDTYTGQLRDQLQARFGDGGRGLGQPGQPFAGYRQESMTTSQSSGWTAQLGHRRDPTPPFGLTGVRLTAGGPGSRISRGTCTNCRFGGTFDRFSIHLLGQPDGGLVDVIVDGMIVGRVSTASPDVRLFVAAFGADELSGSVDADAVGITPVSESTPFRAPLVLDDGPHTVEVVAFGDGVVSVLGIATDRSVGGARVEEFGLNGAVASHWASFDPVLVGGEVTARAPALVAIAFGTNEAFGSQFEVPFDPGAGADAYDAVVQEERERAHAYSRVVAGLLQTLQTDPETTACLVIMPPDFEDEDAPCQPMEFSTEAGAAQTLCVTPPPRSLEVVRSGLQTAAELQGCAIWDTQLAMGGPMSHSRWQRATPALARNDGVHLSSAGYDAIGDALYADLMAAYERWGRGARGDLETTRIGAHTERE